MSSNASNEKNDLAKVTISPVKSFTANNLNTNEIITSFTSTNGHTVQVTNNVDPAMKIALKDNLSYDEEADKKLVRKLDLYLMPVFCLLYATQYMDKSAMSIGAILGLEDYFEMEGDMYAWCGSAFYFGYLVFEFPASYLLQKFPLSKTLVCFIFLWGIISFAHGLVKNYPGFVCLRVILGMLESAVTPGMVMLTGQYYKGDEHFLRSTIWFASNGIGTILSNCIGLGMVEHGDSYSIPSWKVNFFVYGALSIFVAAVFLFHVPDDPSKAWFLSEKEKAMVVARLRENQQGFGNKKWKWSQFKEAILDIITWYYFFYGVSSDMPSGALGTFGSILFNDSFGFSTKDSMTMKMIAGAVEFVGCIALAWLTPYCMNSRMFVSWLSTVIVIAGSCMLAFAGNKNVQLAGYYIQELNPLSMIQCLACFSSNTAGQTKKITMDAIFLIGYCAGQLSGAQTMIDSQAPDYIGGKIAFVVTYTVSMFLIMAIWYEYWRRNKKRDKEARDHPEILASVKNIENIEFADLTDKENPYFRYIL